MDLDCGLLEDHGRAEEQAARKNKRSGNNKSGGSKRSSLRRSGFRGPGSLWGSQMGDFFARNFGATRQLEWTANGQPLFSVADTERIFFRGGYRAAVQLSRTEEGKHRTEDAFYETPYCRRPLALVAPRIRKQLRQQLVELVLTMGTLTSENGKESRLARLLSNFVAVHPFDAAVWGTPSQGCTKPSLPAPILGPVLGGGNCEEKPPTASAVPDEDSSFVLLDCCTLAQYTQRSVDFQAPNGPASTKTLDVGSLLRLFEQYLNAKTRNPSCQACQDDDGFLIVPKGTRQVGFLAKRDATGLIVPDATGRTNHRLAHSLLTDLLLHRAVVGPS